MYDCPVVETPRLILRPIEESDLEAYFRIHDTPAVREALHLPASFNRDTAWQGIAAWRGQWALRHSGNWGVELKETGELIGRAGLHRPERDLAVQHCFTSGCNSSWFRTA